jgi:hypothetical protein
MRLRSSHEILLELLPRLDNPITADQAADKWPEDEPRGMQSIRSAFTKLARRGVLQRRDLAGNHPVYTWTPRAQPEPKRTPQEANWRAFRSNMKGYLESL